jgi:hypothetical protein
MDLKIILSFNWLEFQKLGHDICLILLLWVKLSTLAFSDGLTLGPLKRNRSWRLRGKVIFFF